MLQSQAGASSQIAAEDDSQSALQVDVLAVFALAAVGLWLFFSRGWYRLRDAPQRPAAFTPVVAIAMLVLLVFSARAGTIVAMLVTGIEVSEETGIEGLTIDQLAKLQMGAYALQLSIIPVYIWMRAAAEKVTQDNRSCRTRAALHGALTLLVVWPCALVASAAFTAILNQPVEQIAHDLLRRLIEDDQTIWTYIMAGIVVLITPIVEELTYRGILQSGLVVGGIPRWIAIAGTSIVFAGMHWTSAEPNAVVALFVFSMGLGWVYEKTGRLTAPIAMHMLFNAGNFVLATVMA